MPTTDIPLPHFKPAVIVTATTKYSIQALLLQRRETLVTERLHEQSELIPLPPLLSFSSHGANNAHVLSQSRLD
jgi:hypothetical protein